MNPGDLPVILAAMTNALMALVMVCMMVFLDNRRG